MPNNLIDKSYFVGDILLVIDDYNEDLLDNTIAREQARILKSALGTELYNEFITDIESNNPDQKFIDLRDGKEYEVTIDGEDYTIAWGGVKQMLAYFVYFEFCYLTQNQTSSLGEVQSNQENSTNKSTLYKAASAHLEGLRRYGFDVYIEFSNLNKYQYADLSDKIEESLYNFIYYTNLETPDTYENWKFKEIESQNFLNI